MKIVGLALLLLMSSCAGAAMFDDGTDALIYNSFLNPTGSYTTRPLFVRHRDKAILIHRVVKPLDTIINNK